MMRESPSAMQSPGFSTGNVASDWSFGLFVAACLSAGGGGTSAVLVGDAASAMSLESDLDERDRAWRTREAGDLSLVSKCVTDSVGCDTEALRECSTLGVLSRSLSLLSALASDAGRGSPDPTAALESFPSASCDLSIVAWRGLGVVPLDSPFLLDSALALVSSSFLPLSLRVRMRILDLTRLCLAAGLGLSEPGIFAPWARASANWSSLNFESVVFRLSAAEAPEILR